MLQSFEQVNMQKLNFIRRHPDKFRAHLIATGEWKEDDVKQCFNDLESYIDLYDNTIINKASKISGGIHITYKQHALNFYDGYNPQHQSTLTTSAGKHPDTFKLKTRKYAKGPALQNMPGIIRGSITDDLYYDFDMQNAGPTCLMHIIKLTNQKIQNLINTEIDGKDDTADLCNDIIDTKALSLYIKDRNKIINDILIANQMNNPSLQNSKIIKRQVITAIIYGGLNSANILEHKTPWLNDFIAEQKHAQAMIWKYNPQYHTAIKKDRANKEKGYNYEGALTGQLVFHTENLVLECMFNYLKNRKIINVVRKEKGPRSCIYLHDAPLIFDGLMLLKETIHKQGIDKNQLARDLSYEVFKTLNIPMTIINKPMETFDSSLWMDIPEYSELRQRIKELPPIDDEPLFSDEDDEAFEHSSNLRVVDTTSGNVGQKLTDIQIKKFIKTAQTDGDFADYFVKEYSDMFKVLDNILYYFNGVYWEETKDTILYNKLDAMYWSLKKVMDSMDDLIGKEAINVFSNIQKLRMTKPLKNIIEAIYKRIELNKDIFDKNEFLLGFINGTYDLTTDTFRKGKQEDYITRVIPYEYKELESLNSGMLDDNNITNAISIFNDFIDKIMPVKEERDFLLKALSTTLHNKLTENILFLQGNGRNGKDTLMNLLRNTLGTDMYYQAPNHLLTLPLKPGANPEVANMHKKRAIVYNEPDAKSYIRCNTVKKLTGTDIMPVRGLYSSRNETNMVGTHIVLQNDLLKLDVPDDAMANRLYVIEFKAMFRTKEVLDELPEDTQYAYELNSFYKSNEFYEKCRLPLLHALLNAYKQFRDEGYILKNAPKTIRDLSKAYLSESNEVNLWFHEQYMRSDEDVIANNTMVYNYVKMKDVYALFKTSDLWQNMNKADRRRLTKAKFEKDIMNIPALRPFYRERYNPNRNIDITNVIIKYTERPHDA